MLCFLSGDESGIEIRARGETEDGVSHCDGLWMVGPGEDFCGVSFEDLLAADRREQPAEIDC